jgi:hypothetical protein
MFPALKRIAALEQDLVRSQSKYFQIKEQRPIVNVIYVKHNPIPHLFCGFRGTSMPVNLGPSSNAGLNTVAVRVFCNNLFAQLLFSSHDNWVRPWANERHSAVQDVEQLRQLIEARSTKKAADSGYAAILTLGLHLTVTR